VFNGPASHGWDQAPYLTHENGHEYCHLSLPHPPDSEAQSYESASGGPEAISPEQGTVLDCLDTTSSHHSFRLWAALDSRLTHVLLIWKRPDGISRGQAAFLGSFTESDATRSTECPQTSKDTQHLSGAIGSFVCRLKTFSLF
jgi:hypothetical protein